MNDFFVRDTSRKIKSVFKAKGMIGKHLIGTVIYGYLWADEQREQWIVDEEAAAVVRHIFAMTMDGHGPYQIAQQLTADKMKIPAVHLITCSTSGAMFGATRTAGARPTL